MMMGTAETVPSGHLVLYRIRDRDVVGLKAVRHGKDHVNHYFVPLELISPITVAYLDDTAPLHDCNDHFSLKLDQLVIEPPIAVGTILANATGTYIKACEATKGIISFVYVNLDSGELRRRQERQISAIYRWTLTCIGIDPRREPQMAGSLS
ncbi:hypothetical protein RIEGSTA812A_PEG_1068 [invertebrate metagenome]|uniref:Uncharacterized protein n=1 Tax=invertebrate metagenome TaxID=1711999 RepID=A0A484H7V7_9ZZZZ